MKVLSICQPWAWLIVNGWKDIENRNWPTKFRGEFLVHASKGITRAEHANCIDPLSHVGGPVIDIPSFGDLERGGIVGIAEIVDCVRESDSPWYMGEFGFVLRNARPLPFIPMRGMLGFFNAPDNFKLSGADHGPDAGKTIGDAPVIRKSRITEFDNQKEGAPVQLEGDAKDAARLNFVFAHSLPIERDGMFHMFGFAQTGWHATRIEAIDAAIAASTKEEP